MLGVARTLDSVLTITRYYYIHTYALVLTRLTPLQFCVAPACRCPPATSLSPVTTPFPLPPAPVPPHFAARPAPLRTAPVVTLVTVPAHCQPARRAARASGV